MATYQGERYLQEQLASIACQTRLPDELVVSDDGSTDATLDIVRSYAARVPLPVKLLADGQHRGVSANFLNAIDASRGDVIALSDQDDSWLPFKLALTESAFRADTTSAFLHNSLICNSELAHLGYTSWDFCAFDISATTRSQKALFRALFLNRTFPNSGHALAFRGVLKRALPRSLLRWNIGIYDHLVTIAAAACGELVFSETPLVLYRQHPGQLIGMARRKNIRPRRRMIRSIHQAGTLDDAATALAAILTALEEAVALDRGSVEGGGASEPLPLCTPAWAIARPFLCGYIEHLRRRTGASRAHTPRRVALVLRNADGYFEYSLGLRSMARDIVNPGRDTSSGA